MIKRQSTILASLHREISFKMTYLRQSVQGALCVSVDKLKLLIVQSRSKKAQDKQPKLFSWHAPEVECIFKGKIRKTMSLG